MSRFLFVVPPIAGHVNPAGAIAHVLGERGHEVAWVGSQARLHALLGPDAVVYPTGMRVFRGQLEVGTAAVKSLWEGFIAPFARFILPAVEKAVEAFSPDVIAADQVALAGAIVAHRHRLPWATLLASSFELARPFRDELPRVDAWTWEQRTAVWAAAGLPGEVRRFSPYLVIAFTGQALTAGKSFPGHVALVGAALAGRIAGPDFPWDWLDPARRHVVVTVGTLAADVAAGPASFYARAVDALAPLGGLLQAIVVAPAGAVPDPPRHVLVAPRVPLLELMPHLHAVVSHGGLNTVCEALSFGVPLVVAPIRHDQPFNAAQVAAAGAGIRVNFGRATPDQLRAAVTAVIENPAYRDAARQAADSLAASGGAQAGAERLELLAGMTAH
jgi:UDP:flavonoid glycosyltransferase YjiC (YdhE family)